MTNNLTINQSRRERVRVPLQFSVWVTLNKRQVKNSANQLSTRKCQNVCCKQTLSNKTVFLWIIFLRLSASFSSSLTCCLITRSLVNTNIPIASSLLIKRYDLTLFKARTFLSLSSSLFVFFHDVLAHVCFQGSFLFFAIVNFSMIALSLLMPDNYLIHLHHTFAIRVHVKFHELHQSFTV